MGEELDIDLFRTEFGVGASIAAAGLDAKIAYDIPRFRRMPLCGGETAYKLSILRNILGKLDRKLKITMDNHTIVSDCLLTAVCNGGWYGGGFNAAPECAIDDGLLDVMVVRKISLARIARVLPLYQKGRHFLNGEIVPKLRDAIDFHRCRRVEIEVADHRDKPIAITIDGECHTTTKLTVEMLPMKRKVITTNTSVLTGDFYHENNFLIIDRANPQIDMAFFDTPYVPVSEDILTRYSPEYFARCLFPDLEG